MTATPVDPDDLTARARIRDAAIALFTERGLQAATVRDIARRAGVSAALVRHHFGSKDELREACDAYVVDRILSIKQDALDQGLLTDGSIYATFQPAFLPLLRYLTRAMVDGSDGAARIFDRMVERTEEWLRANEPGFTQDPRAVAAVMVAQSAGLNLLHAHVSRAVGADVLAPEGHPRLALALFDLFSQPLIDREASLKAHAALAQQRPGGTPE